ncbi:MAG: hypothetical protein KDE27_25475 [Planctomycetes bacterium]|nr:hypothetical protein [Planctomycetota bacterium]
MHKTSLGCLAAIALGVSATAQNFIGFNYNGQVGATSRGSLTVNAGEVMTRIGGEDYAGWGTDTAGSRTITSLYYIVQDQDTIATPGEVYDVVVYPEDPLLPGYPDLTQRIPFATGVVFPTATSQIAAFAVTLTPTNPVAVPIQGGGSVFVAFALPAAAIWPSDGVSIQVVLGYQPSPTFLVYDIPGQAQDPFSTPDPTNSHGLSNVGGVVNYDSRRNQMIDIEHSSAGGIPTGITNQTTLLGSANPPPAGFGPCPGTGDFMSGVAPDVSQLDPTRFDDVAMDYYRFGSNTPLTVFLIDFGTFFPELPIVSLGAPAGSTGVACTTPGTALNAGIVFGSADESFKVLSFPASSRAALVGFALVQQAVEFDTTTGLLHASPCGRQVF